MNKARISSEPCGRVPCYVRHLVTLIGRAVFFKKASRSLRLNSRYSFAGFRCIGSSPQAAQSQTVPWDTPRISDPSSNFTYSLSLGTIHSRIGHLSARDASLSNMTANRQHRRCHNSATSLPLPSLFHRQLEEIGRKHFLTVALACDNFGRAALVRGKLSPNYLQARACSGE